MSLLDDLIIVGSIGTSRRAPVLPASDGLLGEAMQLLSKAEAEDRLLGAIAVLGQYGRCGRQPVAAPPTPEPAERDVHPPCSRRAGDLLAQVLAMPDTATKEHLVMEWLDQAARTGQRVEHRLLPALLDYAAANRSCRDMVMRVIDARGQWLTRHNDRWHFASAGSDDPHVVWTTGTLDQRVAMLRRIRIADPSAAREMISSSWSEDPAEDRAAFTAAMRIGLSAADEAFLESALDDRSKQVRAAGANLLARLPGSAYVRRMVGRAGPLLRLERVGGSSRSVVARVTLPPEPFDPGWLRDGIVEQPAGGLGRRQAWFAQFIASVPPTHWSQSWQAPAATCVAAAQASEYADLLLAAWYTAVERHPDPSWIAALLRAGTGPGGPPPPLDLLNHLPAGEQHALVTEILQSPSTTLATVAELVRVIRFSLDGRAAGALLARLGGAIDPRDPGYHLLGAIWKEAAVRLPPDMHDELAQRSNEDRFSGGRGAMDELLRVLLIRRDLRREFNA